MLPVSWWRGVKLPPDTCPVGLFTGVTSGDRELRAAVGAPRTLVGSAGGVGAGVVACCASNGMRASRAPPAADAAPVSSERLLIERSGSWSVPAVGPVGESELSDIEG